MAHHSRQLARIWLQIGSALDNALTPLADGGKLIWILAHLNLSRYDHGADLTLAPLLAWSRGLWDGMVDRPAMQDAWRHGIRTTGLAGKIAIGSASAASTAVRSLGWKCVCVNGVGAHGGGHNHKIDHDQCKDTEAPR